MRALTFGVWAANDWLHEVPEDTMETQVNSMLFLAHQCMQRAEATTQGMSSEHAQAFQRIHDMLSAVMPKMAQAAYASSTKGAIGEESMDDTIAQAFPQCRLRDTSGLAHGGDRILETYHGNILIEFKDYQSAVPDREAQKFMRDVRECGCKFGVMCSFDTHIARKPRDRLTIEKVGSTTVVYIPRAGRDGKRLLCALEFAIWELSQNHSSASESARDAQLAAGCLQEVDALYRELSASIDRLQKEIHKIGELRSNSLASLRANLRLLGHEAA